MEARSHLAAATLVLLSSLCGGAQLSDTDGQSACLLSGKRPDSPRNGSIRTVGMFHHSFSWAVLTANSAKKKQLKPKSGKPTTQDLYRSGPSTRKHFSPVQPVLQQLHVLAGVLLQAALCKGEGGREREGRRLVTRTSASIRHAAVSGQQITALIPLKQTHH